MSYKNIFLVISVLLLVLTLFFYGLSKRDLWDPDEGRYAEIAREMIESGDYITPKLNYEDYNKKPPFFFWLSVISYKLFPMEDYAPRYVSAIFGAGCIFMVFIAGTKLFCFESGALAALILVTGLEFLALSRAIVTDMALTFFVTSSIICFFIFSFKLSKHLKLYKYLTFILTGFAFISKGPLGIIIPGLVIFCYIVFFKEYEILKNFLRPSGFLLFFIVVLPWYIISALKNPGFLYDNLIYENIMRYFTDVHERSGSLFYYVPVVLGGFFPWIFFLPFHITKETFRNQTLSPKLKAVFLWICAVFVFFSLSKSKLPSYIISVYPPLAIIAGKGWRDFFYRDSIKYVKGSIYGLLGVLIAIDLLAFSSYIFFPDIVALIMNFISEKLLFSAVAFLNIWIAIIIVLTQQKKKIPIFVMLILFILTLFIAGISNIEVFDKYKSNKPLALLVKEMSSPADEIIFYKFFKPSFIYYVERKIKRIDHVFQLSYRLNNLNPENDEYYLFRKRDLDNIFKIISEHKLIKKGENQDLILMVRKKNNESL